MIQRLIYDPEVTRAIVEHARENGVPEDVAFETGPPLCARDRAVLLRHRLFRHRHPGRAIAEPMRSTVCRVGVYDSASSAEVHPDATVIFVMNHRSNMDYVLVTYLAAQPLGPVLCGGRMGAGLAAYPA